MQEKSRNRASMSSAGEVEGGGGVCGALCLAPQLFLHPVKLIYMQ